jgi:hypothetical protein
MAFPDHLLTLATLRLLTLTPLASSYSDSGVSSESGVPSSGSSSGARFHSVKSRPLRILTELTAAYLQLLATAAKDNAEQGGRTIVNALDAKEAIQAQYGGSLSEILEWAGDCQLDKGILHRNEDGMPPAVVVDEVVGGDGVVAAADRADLGALLKGGWLDLTAWDAYDNRY